VVVTACFFQLQNTLNALQARQSTLIVSSSSCGVAFTANKLATPQLASTSAAPSPGHRCVSHPLHTSIILTNLSAKLELN
jgi:hypothetical protein